MGIVNYSLPKNFYRIIHECIPNFSNPISISCSIYYRLDPNVKPIIFSSIQEVLLFEKTHRIVEEYEIEENKLYQKEMFFYTEDDIISLTNFLKQLLQIINGDLSLLDEFWIIHRSTGYIRSPVVKNIVVTYTKSERVLNERQKYNLLNSFAYVDKLLMFRNVDSF